MARIGQKNVRGTVATDRSVEQFQRRRKRPSGTGIERILVDYQAASEDARYRDRLITQTFYLAFVVGGLLLNGIITVVFQSSVTPVARFSWLTVVTLVGLVSFIILLVFVESFQNSRDSAWARRSEIESYVRSSYPGVLGTNESISESLSFSSAKGGSALCDDGKSWFARRSASGMMRYFLIGSALVSLVGFVISIGLLAWNVGT